MRLSDLPSILRHSENISSCQGLYFLKGREEIIKTRLKRYRLAQNKFKKALFATRIFSWVPFARLMAVCNTLGWNNAGEGSDIDFFVVVQHGRIFFARGLMVLLADTLRLRPRGENKKDKICLSFFISDENLSLQELSYPTLCRVWPGDVYLNFWTHQLAVIFDKGGVYNDFIAANAWTKKFLPHVFFPRPGIRRVIGDSLIRRLCKYAAEWSLNGVLGDTLENLCARYQKNKLPWFLKQELNKGTNVMMSPQVLKFHGHDRRELLVRQFLAKYQGLAN